MKRPPKPCRQKHHGKRPDQLFCVISADGKQKKIYFGDYTDPTAWEKYRSFISHLDRAAPAAILSTALPAVACLNVGDLCEQFLLANKTVLSPAYWEMNRRVFLDHLAPFFHIPINDFGAPQLRLLQRQLDGPGKYVKSTVTSYLGIIRHLFRWGRLEGLVSRETVVDLTEAPTRSTSHVNPPRESVPLDDYLNTLPFLASPYREIIQLLYLTGARPSEILNMQTSEIDRSGETWLYRPAHHKNEHRGKTRIIPLGPKARALITGWLADHPKRSGYLFQRRDCLNARIKNTDPMNYLLLKDRVADAAKAAGVSHWSPYQLRHLVATEIQRANGIEAAGYVLGHASINTTQIYIDRDTAAAAKITENRG